MEVGGGRGVGGRGRTPRPARWSGPLTRYKRLRDRDIVHLPAGKEARNRFQLVKTTSQKARHSGFLFAS